MKNKNTSVPIFFACDDSFVKYAIVSIRSLIDNASKNRLYKVYILNAGVSNEMVEKTNELNCDNVKISFVDVKDYLNRISDKLPIRDYYTKTTYYRMFIANMFPQYKKALYIDSDVIIKGDVGEMYDIDLGDNLVGAVKEQVMIQEPIFGDYAEKVTGVNRNEFFNAGVLSINCKAFRKENVLKKFIELLGVYTFVVTQDEDYLNVICKGRVCWLDAGWNTEVFGDIIPKEDEIKIIHYIMTNKPWRYVDCKFGDVFWEYAKKCNVYEMIKTDLENYTDAERERDQLCVVNLKKLAIKESSRIDTYAKIKQGKSFERLSVLEKIRKLELEKKFDCDVEDDPETIILLPDKVDYLGEKLSTRFNTWLANIIAQSYYEKLIKKGEFIIKGVNGLENYKSVNGGAIITCNHFSPLDNYAIWRSIRKEFKKGKRLYKIIKEGNFTNFNGLYGYFFRHCNTLPLSSNVETMKKLMLALKKLLSDGEKILIYPEQAMWWNYKKPRPLKIGAYKFAVKNNVPVIPAFITMEDTDKVGSDGFNIQAYTVWFLPPIYPDAKLTEKESAYQMMEKNFSMWKDLYERVYGEELRYE